MNNYEQQNKKLGFVALTPRELDCIEWLIKGKSANEIALILNITKRTVETHIENIKRKFRCKKLTELTYLIGQANIKFH